MITKVSENTKDKIAYFKKRFSNLGYGESHYIFVCHAAFPIALTPDLLSQLWANFKHYNNSDGVKNSIDQMAISDVLLSPLVREVSRDVFEMDAGTRAFLLQELEKDERFGLTRMKELGYFLYQYIQEVAVTKHNKAFVDAQTWTALASLAPQQAAQELVEALRQAISNRNDNEILRIRNLLESYSNQDEAFENLLHYSKGLKAAILNFPKETIQKQFDRSAAKVLTLEEGATVSNTILDIPMLEELETSVEMPEEVISTDAMEKAMYRIQKEKEEQTGTLDLSKLELETIPKAVFELTHLKVLDLYVNNITSLPDEIRKLKNLEKLLVSINPIQAIPPSLFQLQKLQQFKLDKGKLKDFPNVLLSIQSLQNISMEDNEIDFLPPGIAQLENLKLLDLRDNPIVNLPKDLLKRTGQTIRDYFKKIEPLPKGKNVLLFLGSDPEQKFNLRKEKDQILDALKNLAGDNKIELDPDKERDQLNLNIVELCELLQIYQNQALIIHFAVEEMSFPDEAGKMVTITPELLSKIMGSPTTCKVVLFNSKNSTAHAELISNNKNIATIGMKRPISDEAAIDYAKHFYEQLAAGKTLAEIFDSNDEEDFYSNIQQQKV